MINRRQFITTSSTAAMAAMFCHRAMGESPLGNQGFATLPIGGMDAKAVGDFKAAGYGYLELSVSGWLDPRTDDTVFAQKLEELKNLALPVQAMNGFLPKEGFRVCGTDANPEAIVEWSKRAFTRAKQVGVDVITFGSGGARKIPENFARDRAQAQFSALLGRLGPIARDAGVRLAIENLNRGETNMGNTLDECFDLVVQSGSPDVFLTHDIFHSLRENEGPEVIHKAAARIVHCHVAENEKRTQPGVSGQDFRPYLKALQAIGYTGRFSFECSWVGGVSQGAAPAIQVFRKQMA